MLRVWRQIKTWVPTRREGKEAAGEGRQARSPAPCLGWDEVVEQLAAEKSQTVRDCGGGAPQTKLNQRCIWATVAVLLLLNLPSLVFSDKNTYKGLGKPQQFQQTANSNPCRHSVENLSSSPEKSHRPEPKATRRGPQMGNPGMDRDGVTPLPHLTGGKWVLRDKGFVQGHTTS